MTAELYSHVILSVPTRENHSTWQYCFRLPNDATAQAILFDKLEQCENPAQQLDMVTREKFSPDSVTIEGITYPAKAGYTPSSQIIHAEFMNNGALVIDQPYLYRFHPADGSLYQAAEAFDGGQAMAATDFKTVEEGIQFLQKHNKQDIAKLKQIPIPQPHFMKVAV